MIWKSQEPNRNAFLLAAKADPDFVFLEGVLNGRRVVLSLSCLFEEDSDPVILGPGGTWRVHAHRENGRVRTVNIRLPGRRAPGERPDRSPKHQPKTKRAKQE